MTRTDTDAHAICRRVSRRWLPVLPAALMIAAASAAPASATEGLSGYSHTETTKQETKPTSSTTTPAPATTPAQQEVKPSQTSASPPTSATKEVAPTTSTSTTSTTVSQAQTSTLPFTGLDLRWVIVFGLAMLGVGVSIVAVQHRGRRG